jgi:hypothetical protein
MVFEVIRTSTWSDKKPCDNAIEINLTKVETRILGSPEEFDIRFGGTEGKWLESGTNHRLDEEGYITRDMGTRKSWGIEINSLEELMEFKENINNEIIITKSSVDYKTPSIEIYDDYRE